MKTIRDCLMILKIDEMILEAVKDDEEKRDKINEKMMCIDEYSPYYNECSFLTCENK